MKDDDELELLLGEIPHAISFNLNNIHHLKHGGNVGDHNQDRSFMVQKMNGMMFGRAVYDDGTLNHNKNTCASPVSGFSLQSDGSSSSLLSGGHSLSDNGSPTTPPPLEELKPHSQSGNRHFTDKVWMDIKAQDSSFGKKADEDVIDQLSMSRNLSRMYIHEEAEDVTLNLNGHQFCDRVGCRTIGVDFDQHRLSLQSQHLPNYGRFQFHVPGIPMNFEGEMMGSAMLGLGHDYRLGDLQGSRYSHGQSGELCSHLNGGNGAVNSQFCCMKRQAAHQYMGFSVSNLSTLARPSMAEYAKLNGVNVLAENDAFHSPGAPHLTSLKSHNNVGNLVHCRQPIANACNILPSRVRVPHGSLDCLSAEESLIIQGESVNCPARRGYERSRHNNKSSASPYLVDANARQEKRSFLNGCLQIAGSQQCDQSLRPCCPFTLPSQCNSLAEARGYIYCLAKDQHGCRFLQRMFDEGTPQDVQIIFNEVIDHVVELMMNPFGNYLMQKLLEVCKEEQRMQILLRVTAKPGELIRISLNTHG